MSPSMAPSMLAAVAGGGAVGAVARYVIMSRVGHLLGAAFPFGTLAVNVLGAFLLGCIVELMALAWSPSQEVRAFLVVGMMGALTTFSAFSMDLFLLMEKGDILGGGLYVTASVGLCILAFAGGLQLLRLFLA